ncbi:MAG: hypothetical protein KJ752_06540, partial [Alphaproteobacteria bacterium]|nr:hypothetical protein [Alphaproteobacteria bacterium]
DITQSNNVTDLNPYYAKVIGFVDGAGNLVDKPEDEKSYYKLLINVGEKDEVKTGERILVFALGQEMVDPESGDSLGCFEVVRGYGRVVSTQSRMSVIESSRTKTVRFQKAQAINALISGHSVEYGEREEKAPFLNAMIGDLVRFI